MINSWLLSGAMKRARTVEASTFLYIPFRHAFCHTVGAVFGIVVAEMARTSNTPSAVIAFFLCLSGLSLMCAVSGYLWADSR
jgi:hypothetical protein